MSGDVIQTRNYSTGLEYQTNNSNHSLTTSARFNESSSEDNIGDSEGVTFSLSSSNGSAAKNFYWDSTGNYSERKNNSRDAKQHTAEIKIGLITRYSFSPFFRYYDEDNSGNVNSNRSSLETNSYGLGFRWEPIARLIIDASYNEPLNDTLNTSNEEQKAYIDLSIQWQPSSRTQITANHSQRFYGDSYGLNLTHQNRRLTNTITYNEQVQSFSRDNYQLIPSSFLCQNQDATSLEDCFVESGDDFNPENSATITVFNLALIEDNDYRLNKTLSWSSQLTLPRTSFSINLSHSDRENLNTGLKNTAKNLTAGATRNLSPNSKVGLTASYIERGYAQTTSNDQNDIYRRYIIDYSKKINSRLNVIVNLEHQNRSSNNEIYNYSENRISLRLTKDF